MPFQEASHTPSFGGLGLKVFALHLGGFYMLEAAERELIGL